MRILLISDIESKHLWDFFQPEKFQNIDLIISCGDLKAEYLNFLVTMVKAPLFYVPGNHDTRYLVQPPEGCECIDNKLITFKNIRILGLGGSMKYTDSPYLYTEKEMQRKINKLKLKLFFNKGFDILVTHSPAKGINDEKDLCHTGFKCFNKLLDKYSPKYFVHGHVHLNYGIKPRIVTYNDTTIINAYNYHILEY
ncbi:MAG: metallophosphoesterase [Clostridiaceae bacterium]